MGVRTALDAVLTAPSIVDAMRAADDLAFEAGRDPGARTIRMLDRVVRADDELVAIAAIHALSGMLDDAASRVLVGLLHDGREFEREHAAWALGSGLPRYDAVGALLRMVVGGGFTGMLAQRSLEQWSGFAPTALVAGVEGALLGIDDPEARARLVETLGLVRDPLATGPLVRLSTDASEPDPVRVAAVAALGQRPAPVAAPTLEAIAAGDGFLAAVARLALVDVSTTGPLPRRSGKGLTVAQLFLHADLDPGLRSAGAGDNGGIATLLVRLGDALVRDPETGVDRVLTLSRGGVSGALHDLVAVEASEQGHDYGRIPLLHDPVSSADAWPLRVAARRGIRRVLRAAGGADVLHLRMADVGSLAAADVARELGVPVVFTLAPDPHAVIDSLDRSGRLSRADFGRIDLAEHFWFRTRLVGRLAANASHTVLFPRPRLEEDLRRLVGVDPAADPEHRTVVPEGVDTEAVDRAIAEVEAESQRLGPPAAPALGELHRLVEGLDPDRRGRPLVMSVGRLHRVKGMAALVEAWAESPISSRSNLLLVGGDLASPSADEREELARIDAIVPPDERARRGLLLPGHRPNEVVARWLAAARLGLPGSVAPRGVYACASLKEEFGIALVEAMAAGLYVVAPGAGGPATYIEDGETGILTATWDDAQLTAALERAVAVAQAEVDDERAERSRAMVRDRFTVRRMARVLADVYRAVVRDEAALLQSADRAR